MADSKSTAQDKIFAEIARVTDALDDGIGDSAQGLQLQATALRNLALAYRYAAGGPQPGGSGDSK